MKKAKQLRTSIILMLLLAATTWASAGNEKTQFIKCGDMNQWVTRQVKESGIIGGKMKTLYEIAPTKTWPQNAPYTNHGGSRGAHQMCWQRYLASPRQTSLSIATSIQDMGHVPNS